MITGVRPIKARLVIRRETRNIPISRYCAEAAVIIMLLAIAACRAQEPAAANIEALKLMPAENVDGTPRELKVEEVGPASSRAWLAYYPPFKEMALYQDPHKGHWMHLMAFKKRGKDERVTHFALFDVDEGTITELGEIPGWEQYSCIWANNKFYLGMNNIVQPGMLVEFDPYTKTLTGGSPFERNGLLRSLAVGPDGALALGGDPPEVALYDPETKTYTYYGRVGSPASTKVYYISIDEDYIYAVARGTDPWRLISINRETGEQKEILQAPVDGFMGLHRDGTIYTKADDLRGFYYVSDGDIHQVGSLDEARRLKADTIERINLINKPLRKETPPQCYIDESPTFEGRPEMKFLYQKDGQTDVWREIILPTPLAGHSLNRIAPLADGRLAYSGEKYSPLTVWDPDTGKTIQVPNRTAEYSNSVYCMTAVGNTVFAGGYASAIVMAFEPDKAVTQTADLPGRKGTPFNSPEANPRLVGYFSRLANGAHTVVAMEPGADNLVYLSARRHRYFFGFDICWFDPQDFSQRGVIDAGDALDHYQMSWMCLSPDKETLVAGTFVEGNPQIDTPRPADARIFFFDLRGKKLANSVAPLPGVKALSGVSFVDESTLVGVAYLEKSNESVLFRLNVETGAVDMIRKYKGMIHGKPGITDVPAKGYDFTIGPDGYVWTLGKVGNDGAQFILRINPGNLDVQPVCGISGHNIRFLFSDNDLILTGGNNLKKILNVME